jgi:hypothetical protein
MVKNSEFLAVRGERPVAGLVVKELIIHIFSTNSL